MEVSYFSKTLDMQSSMGVILPQKNNDYGVPIKKGVSAPFPVLYFLHGRGGDHSVMRRFQKLELYAQIYGVVIVMPDAHQSFYTDQLHGSPYITFLAEELPGIVSEFFHVSTARKDTYAAGISMGGYGALKLALSRPGIFSAGASLSGAVDVAEICEAQEKNGVTEAFDVMGEASKVRGSNNDLFALCENFDFAGKTAPRLFMCCGTEDMLYWQNVRMRNHIKGLPFDLTYEEEPGTHNWAYWDMKIQSVLKWLNIGGEA